MDTLLNVTHWQMHFTIITATTIIKIQAFVTQHYYYSHHYY